MSKIDPNRKFRAAPYPEQYVGDDNLCFVEEVVAWINTPWYNVNSWIEDGICMSVEGCDGFLLFDHRSGRENDYINNQPAHVFFYRKRHDPHFPLIIRLLDTLKGDAIDSVLTVDEWNEDPDDLSVGRFERSTYFLKPASQTISLTNRHCRAAQVVVEHGQQRLRFLADTVRQCRQPVGYNCSAMIDRFLNGGDYPHGFEDIHVSHVLPGKR